MKIGNAKVGDKFVLDSRGGVWERMDKTEGDVISAKCVFGKKEDFGTVILIPVEEYCYVIFEEKDSSVRVESQEVNMPKIKVIDETIDTFLKEFSHPTMAQVNILASVDTIRLTPIGKRRSRTYLVSELAFDADTNTFYLLVMEENNGGKDDGKGND